MNCPICKAVSLEDHLHRGRIYHQCPECGGLWFDKGELTQLKEEKDWFRIDSTITQARTRIEESSLICPRDRTSMHRIDYQQESGISINICSSCEGLWLDAGELEAIHKAEESWIGKLRDYMEDELTAVELFLIKIGPYLPQ